LIVCPLHVEQNRLPKTNAVKRWSPPRIKKRGRGKSTALQYKPGERGKRLHGGQPKGKTKAKGPVSPSVPLSEKKKQKHHGGPPTQPGLTSQTGPAKVQKSRRRIKVRPLVGVKTPQWSVKRDGNDDTGGSAVKKAVRLHLQLHLKGMRERMGFWERNQNWRVMGLCFASE